MLLELREICHFYGPRLIFKDVTFELDRGSVLLLAGANGAGKSTLLKIIAGLVRPESGVCLLDKGARPGYLGHNTFLYPDLTALENLRFWSSLNELRIRDALLLAMLERMELAAFADEKAGGFSRGMAQRLNLARVFLLKPDLLLLDEPGTGLDTRSMAVLRREITEAAAAGAGLVWISHNLDQDCALADKVALLEAKKLCFYGSVADYALFARSRDMENGPGEKDSASRPALKPAPGQKQHQDRDQDQNQEAAPC